jgi:hypothetical protein
VAAVRAKFDEFFLRKQLLHSQQPLSRRHGG